MYITRNNLRQFRPPEIESKTFRMQRRENNQKKKTPVDSARSANKDLKFEPLPGLHVEFP